MGLGGLIAQGMLGAVVGGTHAAVEDITARQKEEMETRRQQMLSQLRMQEHAANAQVTADIGLATDVKKRDQDLAFRKLNGDDINDLDAKREVKLVGAKADATSEAAARNSERDNDTEMNKVLAHAAAVNAAKTQEEKAMEKAKLDSEIAKAGLSRAEASKAYAMAGLESAKENLVWRTDPNEKGSGKGDKIIEDKWRKTKGPGGQEAEASELVPGVVRWTTDAVPHRDAEKNWRGKEITPERKAAPVTEHYSYKGNEISPDEYASMRDKATGERVGVAKDARKGIIADRQAGATFDWSDTDSRLADAKEAIRKGAPKDKVAAEYLEKTGKPLPF